MARTELGKDALDTGVLYFQAQKKLLRQKQRIERELLKLQGKVLRAASRKSSIVSRKYVPRLENTTTLVEAIRQCMVPGKKMRMVDILKSLTRRNLYHTKSKYFYTMINNKLNRDPLIEKVSRGVFVYRPKRRKTVA